GCRTKRNLIGASGRWTRSCQSRCMTSTVIPCSSRPARVSTMRAARTSLARRPSSCVSVSLVVLRGFCGSASGIALFHFWNQDLTSHSPDHQRELHALHVATSFTRRCFPSGTPCAGSLLELHVHAVGLSVAASRPTIINPTIRFMPILPVHLMLSRVVA